MRLPSLTQIGGGASTKRSGSSAMVSMRKPSDTKPTCAARVPSGDTDGENTPLTTDEANLIDLIKFGQGNRFSLTHLEPELSRLDLTERYRSFAVPIVFLLGHYDRHIPSELAEQYFNMIEAPCKRLLWFDQSGHNPPFEEPERFTAIMIKDVLPLAADGCAQ